MANKNIATLSVDALFKLRDDVTSVLAKKTADLQMQLSRLTGSAPAKRAYNKRKGPRKGMKVAPKYRGPGGELWSGRGMKPRWLTAELKSGKKIEQFAIGAKTQKKRK